MLNNPIHHLNFSHLIYFLSAAKHMKFSDAANECHVVLSVISKQISNLEAMLDVQLFVHYGKTMVLTENGAILYKRMQHMVELFSDLLSDMLIYDKLMDTALRIGYYDMLSEQVLTRIVRSFKKTNRNVFISLNYVDMVLAMSAVKNDFMDVIFLFPATPTEDEDLECFQLLSSKMNFVVPKSHHLSNRDYVSLDEIQSEYIASLDSTISKSFASMKDREVVNEKYTSLGLHRFTNIHTVGLKRDSGLEVGVLPEMLKKIYSDRYTFLNIVDESIPLPVSIIWNKNNKNVIPFIEFVKSEYAEILKDFWD